MTISASPELFNSSYLGLDIDLFVEDEAHFRMSYVGPNGEVKETIHPFGVPLEGPNLALTITLKDKSVFDLSDPSGPRIKIDALEQARKQHYRFRVFNRGQRIDQMRGGLQVDNVMGTNILTLQASSTLPGRPKTFLNILGKSSSNTRKRLGFNPA